GATSSGARAQRTRCASASSRPASRAEMSKWLVPAVAAAALVLPASTAAGAAPLEFCAADKTLAPHLVRFRAADGARLLGVALGRGGVGVVLSHQLGSDFCEWVPYAKKLSREGYRTLAFSFR